MRTAFLLSLHFVQSLASAQQQCHFYDGTVAADHTPCSSSELVTHCCGYGQACLSNGLCFVAWDTSVWTGTCTDTRWLDSSCFQQYKNSKSLTSLLFSALCIAATATNGAPPREGTLQAAAKITDLSPTSHPQHSYRTARLSLRQ